jgi:uncharacterized damage-inducible protein DinB
MGSAVEQAEQAKSMGGPLLQELREEAAITKRVLRRVPADKLSWQPHPKSMTLGQLAWHVATTPGTVSRIAQQSSFDVAQGSFVPPQPKNLEEILDAYESSVRDAEGFLGGLTDEQAMANWRLLRNGSEVAVKPRITFVRSVMLNHWYHHRGQLSVYLRLLDVPIPVIYGRSADESPFD